MSNTAHPQCSSHNPHPFFTEIEPGADQPLGLPPSFGYGPSLCNLPVLLAKLQALALSCQRVDFSFLNLTFVGKVHSGRPHERADSLSFLGEAVPLSVS